MHPEEIDHLVEQLMQSSQQLMLLNAPTGSGKTYAIIHVLCVRCRTDPNFHAWFVSDQKKNLKVADFIDAWGDEAQFYHHAAVLRGLVDTVDELLNNDPLPIALKTPVVADLLKTLRFQLQTYHYADKQHAGVNTAYQALQQSESALRQALAADLAQRAGQSLPLDDTGIAAVQKWVREDAGEIWRWFDRVYPTIDLEARQLYILTTSKFILTYQPFFAETSQRFLDSRLLPGSLVVLDEFDATMKTLQQQEIEEALKLKLDLVRLFHRIQAALNNVTALPITVRERFEDEAQLKQLQQAAGKLLKQYHLDLLYKTEQPIVGTGFVINTPQRTIVSANRRWQARVDEANNRVLLEQPDKSDQPDQSRLHFETMLIQLARFIRRFVNFITAQSQWYIQTTPSMTPQDAASSLYDALGFATDQIKTLLAIGQAWPVTYHQAPTARQWRYQDEGLSVFSLTDADSHDLRTNISAAFLQMTPERYLLSVLKKAKVLGLSATATLPTVLDNYDLDYLKAQLDAGLIEGDQCLAPATLQALDLAPRYAAAGVKVQAELAGWADSIADLVHKRYPKAVGDFKALDIALKAQLNLIGESAEYCRNRYLALIDSFIVFLQDSDMTSFLGLQEVLPKMQNYPEMDQPFLQQVFDSLQEALTDDDCELVVVAKTEASVEKCVHDALQLVTNGKRIYLLSAYNTIGVGQDLQHDLGEGEAKRVRSIAPSDAAAADPRRKKADLAGLYLGAVTHILPSGSFTMDAEGVGMIVALERLYDAYDIDYATLRQHFLALATDSPVRQPQAARSYTFSYARMIIQAIGRMHRTFNRMPKLRVLAHKDVLDKLQNVLAPIFHSPELDALLALDPKPLVDQTKSLQLIRWVNLTADTRNDLNRLLRGSRNNQAAADGYDRLRWEILRHPTRDELPKDVRIGGQYLPNPKRFTQYLAQSHGDAANWIFGNGEEISAAAAGFPTLLEYRGLSAAFAEANIPTTWAPHANILNPVQYRNLYRGALGEFAGRFIVEHEWGVALKRFADLAHHELFDYWCGNVAYDFKYWRQAPKDTDGKQRTWVAQKLALLQADTGQPWQAVIINVIQPAGQPTIEVHGNCMEVSGLIDAAGKMALTPEQFKQIGAWLQ